MSSEKETSEAVEAAKRFEEGMELINRVRNEAAAVLIETPRERAIADFMAEADLEPNPLDINSNVVRRTSAARMRKIGAVQ